jgi:hypothetical protein
MDLADELQELRSLLDAQQRTIDEQQRQLDTLRRRQPPASPDRPSGTDQPHDRRSVLKHLGLMAAGTVVGGAVTSSASPAAAAAGDNLILGQANHADTTTVLNGRLGVWSSSEVWPSLAVGSGRAVEVDVYGGLFAVLAGVGGPGEGEPPWIAVRGLGEEAGIGGAFSGMQADLRIGEPGGMLRVDHYGHDAGELKFLPGDDLWLCVGGAPPDEPGIWQKLGGSATAGQLHVLGAPARVYDSRAGQLPLDVPKGQISNGAERVVDSRLDLGELPAGASPSSVLLNLTITDTTSLAGWLALFRNGEAWPGSSTINWDAKGRTAANTTVVGIDHDGLFKVKASPGGGAHFVVDVIGYWL